MFGIPEEHIDNLIKTGNSIVENPTLSLIEECGELITALSKFGNDRVAYGEGVEHIAEEMTHVLVSMNLVARKLGIRKNDIKEEIIIKAVNDGWNVDEYN